MFGYPHILMIIIQNWDLLCAMLPLSPSPRFLCSFAEYTILLSGQALSGPYKIKGDHNNLICVLVLILFISIISLEAPNYPIQ